MEERIIELEIRVAHQQDALDEMTRELLRQNRELDDLRETVRQLAQRLQTVAEAGSNSAVDEKPPHY
ncbi:MAG: SlyX family protein [Gammaproteobacteria bacterium]|jgi:SlyX protein